MDTAALTQVRLPTVGTWDLDASHTSVEFLARHLMVAKVRGRFERFSGAITVADPPESSSVEVTIEAASVSSKDEQRDGHLRSADFFDVEQYPAITFRSTHVQGAGSAWAVTGDLTMKDVTRPVVLDVEYHGLITDPWGNEKAVFSASTEVDREDWGLTWNVALEKGGVLVSKKIKLELEVEAPRRAE